MTYNYLEKILRPHEDRFSPTEKAIADHFLELGTEVINKTLSTLAGDIGVSEATIFKFVKKIGFEGFQNFKISVASNFRSEDERRNEPIVFTDISKADSPYLIAQKMVNKNKQLLEGLIQMLSEEKLQEALDLILSCQTVHFFGQGASSVVAFDSYQKFIRTKYQCNYIADYHLQLSYATKLGPNDCAFLFSHSGDTIETIEIAKILRENNVNIITLTGNFNTELVRLSNTYFVVDSEESAFRSETLTSRFLYLTIIDILYVAVMYNDEEKSKQSLEKIRKALSITKTGGSTA